MFCRLAHGLTSHDRQNNSHVAAGLGSGILLSFDDYSETWEPHLPLLESLGIKTTFFVSGEFLRNAMAAEVRLRPLILAGHSLGAHTFSHRRATEMWARDGQRWLQEDVLKQAQTLGQISGQPVRAFAYPHGDWNRNTDKALEAHFHFRRAFGKRIRFTTEPELRAGGLVEATSIDNVQNHGDSWHDRHMESIAQRRGCIWAVASHHIGDSAWGITPARLQRFAQSARERGLQIYRFDDFMP
jgi:peptidoglycan/xylan/chitin deacetylase (PgdA/CDA1 family)